MMKKYVWDESEDHIYILGRWYYGTVLCHSFQIYAKVSWIQLPSQTVCC